MACSPPGSSAHRILQARILEWDTISYPRASSLTQGLNLCFLCLLHWQVDFFFFFTTSTTWEGVSLVAQTVKHLPTMWETQVQPLGREHLLEKEMATHFSTLAWKIPWTEESGRLQSMGSQRVGHDWATSLTHSLHLGSTTQHTHKKKGNKSVMVKLKPDSLVCLSSVWKIPGDNADPGNKVIGAAAFKLATRTPSSVFKEHQDIP